MSWKYNWIIFLSKCDCSKRYFHHWSISRPEYTVLFADIWWFSSKMWFQQVGAICHIDAIMYEIFSGRILFFGDQNWSPKLNTIRCPFRGYPKSMKTSTPIVKTYTQKKLFVRTFKELHIILYFRQICIRYPHVTHLTTWCICSWFFQMNSNLVIIPIHKMIELAEISNHRPNSIENFFLRLWKEKFSKHWLSC